MRISRKKYFEEETDVPCVAEKQCAEQRRKTGNLSQTGFPEQHVGIHFELQRRETEL